MPSVRQSIAESRARVRRDITEITDVVRQSRIVIEETIAALHKANALLAGIGDGEFREPMI